MHCTIYTKPSRRVRLVDSPVFFKKDNAKCAVLNVGDLVEVQSISNGWVVGINRTTFQKGRFPATCCEEITPLHSALNFGFSIKLLSQSKLLCPFLLF
jgi:hypothetical protein